MADYRASALDNGGQGCSKRVMSNQSANLGEPQIQGDGSLRHPASVGEPGFVYFIRAGRTANVKIGCTNSNAPGQAGSLYADGPPPEPTP